MKSMSSPVKDTSWKLDSMFPWSGTSLHTNTQKMDAGLCSQFSMGPCAQLKVEDAISMKKRNMNVGDKFGQTVFLLRKAALNPLNY